MKISKVHQEADKIAEKLEQKQAILTLIDEKIEHDMEKVLNKIDGIRVEMNHKFDNVNSQFDSRFDSVNSKFDSKFDSVNAKIDWLKWLIGSIGVAVLIAALKYAFFS